MDPRHLFVDERLNNLCANCGKAPRTRDHCPPKVLLDDPLPSNVPVVGMCYKCNNSASIDEQYIACLIEVAICGSESPRKISRPKIRRILSETPSLKSLIRAARGTDANGNTFWRPDTRRLKKVLTKLARGHAAYQHGDPRLDSPVIVQFFPLNQLTDEEYSRFESAPPLTLLPEIGSRAFIQGVRNGQMPNDWITVQEGRYRYLVDHGSVRMVLSEYLGCWVSWN